MSSGVPPLLDVPPPPPGPGVWPPFAAPPTDGAKQRRWLGVGLAAGTALVLCVGGLVGLGGIVVLATQVARDDAVAAVKTYLTTLKDGQFGAAYDQLCPEFRSTYPRGRFVAQQASSPRIASFTVGPAELADVIEVPATIDYATGTTRNVRYRMANDSQTGAVEVCGEAG